MRGKFNSGAKGQAQLIAVFLLLVLVPTTVIVAQNTTNSTGVDGMVTDVNLTETPPIEEVLNETEQELPEENTTEPAEEPQVNVTEPQDNVTTPDENVTVPEENITIPEENTTVINETNVTLPEDNVTIPEENVTVINETNVTLPEPTGDNVTEENVTNLPEEADLKIELFVPLKTTRGYDVTLKAVIENTGTNAAENLHLEWDLPEFFEVFIGNSEENIGTLEPDTSFTSEIVVISTTDAVLGQNEIKVRVSYE